MYRSFNQNRKAILIFIDFLSITSSLILAFLLRFDFSIPGLYLNQIINLLPILIIFQILIFNFSGYYNFIWRFTSLWDMVNIIKGVSISNLISFSILGLLNYSPSYPRSVSLMFFILNISMICLSRILVRLYHTHYQSNIRVEEIIKKKLLLIGAGKTGEKITREIIGDVNTLYDLVGFIDDDLSIQNSTIHGVKVLGTIEDLTKINIQFDEILITAPSATGDQIRRIVKQCKLSGKKYKTVPSLSELIDKDITLASIRNVSYIDLLGRDEVKLDMNSIQKTMYGKRILITGAGGSIGSELVRQCLIFKPSEILCLDHSEENIFYLEQELSSRQGETLLKYQLCTINSKAELEKPFSDIRPQIVFHAAAYKHVPIQENHPWSAIKTNVGGTLNTVRLSNKYKVELFILVSTDKAVNPVNVMGATKRVAEKIIQSYNNISETSFMAVRFGNVLGSSGSAIPIFEKQIKLGGPLTITHPEMTRYFMSIQEASQLILQCAALGREGEIFLLDMGKPIKILELARDLIRLSGYEPESDIPIVYTGLRPGEKLYEELQLKHEKKINTEHQKIMILENKTLVDDWISLKSSISILLKAGNNMDLLEIKDSLEFILPSYIPRSLSKSNIKNTEEVKIQA